MSVIIMGMEMPTNCAACPLRLAWCRERIYMETRPTNCPLEIAEEEYMKHYIQGRKDERAIQDALKRPRGEWIPLFPVLCDRPYCYECSNCGSLSGRMTNFCQNCGADMRGQDAE